MQLQRLCLIAPLLLLAAIHGCLADGDIFSDVKKTFTGEAKTGVDFKLGSGGARIGVKTDDGNPFFYSECSAGFSAGSGLGADCQRVWKPLFYCCIAGGAVLAALLLSCCCCCCCAPCRRKRAAAYYPVMNQTTGVLMVNPTGPAVRTQAGYDVTMLHA